MINELKKVIDFIEEIKAKVDTKLYNDGAIEYANGNDGTDFDWEVNGRLCEFGCSNEINTEWVIKCYVENNGKSQIILYKNDEYEIFEKQLMSAEEAEKLKDYMYENYDLKNKWNTTL